MELVYKFAPDTGIKYILENHTLCFTSLQAMNDINEGMSDIGDLVEQQSNAALARMHRHASDNPDNLLHGTTLEQFTEICAMRGFTQAVLDDLGCRIGWQISLKKVSRFGVLSLARTSKNLLMWGHYTDEGRGVCIGIRKSSSVLTDSSFGELTGVHDVRYSDTRVRLTADTLTERLKGIVLTKGRDWEYEQELRCVRELPIGEKRLVVPYDPSDVQEIIVGPRMPVANVKRCYELQASFFPQASLMLAIPNPSKFIMEIRNAPPLRFLDHVWADEVDDVPPLSLPPM